MGAPLSPVLAELIIENFEEKPLKLLKFHIPFFFRYVDDILTCAPENKVPSILKAFLKYHTRIKFEVELEKNNKLSFLDVMAYNNRGNITTNWYQKPTWTGKFLNFSLFPKKLQLFMVFLKKQKIFQIKIFCKKNLEMLKNTLMNNHYLLDFRNKYINIRLNSQGKIITLLITLNKMSRSI